MCLSKSFGFDQIKWKSQYVYWWHWSPCSAVVAKRRSGLTERCWLLSFLQTGCFQPCVYNGSVCLCVPELLPIHIILPQCTDYTFLLPFKWALFTHWSMFWCLSFRLLLNTELQTYIHVWGSIYFLTMVQLMLTSPKSNASCNRIYITYYIYYK